MWHHEYIAQQKDILLVKCEEEGPSGSCPFSTTICDEDSVILRFVYFFKIAGFEQQSTKPCKSEEHTGNLQKDLVLREEY